MFVRAGGGLLVLAGKRTADSSSLTASGLLAGDVGHSVQKRARVTALSPHPALLGLRAEQISHAPVWERVDLQPGADDFVLARFDDGSAALTERRVDAGISLTLATTLERSSSALALEPGFAPLLIALNRYLARRIAGSGTSAITVQEAADLRVHAGRMGSQALLKHLDLGRSLLVETPDGQIIKLDGDKPVFTADRPGLHRIHGPGSDFQPVPLASNPPRSELQPESLNPAEFQARLTPGRSSLDGLQTSGSEDSEMSPTEIWWPVLWVLTALLLLEGLYAARLTRQRVHESHVS